MYTIPTVESKLSNVREHNQSNFLLKKKLAKDARTRVIAYIWKGIELKLQ